MSASILRVTIAASLVFGLAGVCSAQLELDAREGARLCVAESGWRDHATCAAQVHVIRRRAERRGWTFRDMVHAYSAAWRTERRPWILALRDSETPPEGWPENASWAVHRPLFAGLVAVARRALTGGPDPCFGEADHFGSCRLDSPAEGWKAVQCVGVRRQCFYRSH